MSNKVSSVFAVFGLTIGMTSCATSTDPNEGGLLGGLHGLSSGAYEERLEQREASLARLKRVKAELKQEEASLESTKEARQNSLARQTHMLEALSSEVQQVERSLKADKRAYEAKDEEVRNLRARLAKLRTKLNAVMEANERGRIEEKQLRQERRGIEEQYRVLLDIYAGLGGPAGNNERSTH